MAKNTAQNGNAASSRTFVTGVGSVCPVGLGIEPFANAFWRASDFEETGTSGQGPDPVTVPEFDLSDFIDTTRPYVDRHSEFALAAGAMALGWGGTEEECGPEPRSGLATGTLFGNVTSMETFQEIVRAKGMRLASPVLFPHCYSNTSNSLLCIEFGLRGVNQNFCEDLLCSARAIQSGYRAIRNGKADLMLTGGIDALSDSLRDAVSSDAETDDLPVGEGACLLALENEHSISRRGSQPICELVGLVTRGTGVSAPPADDDDFQSIGQTVAQVVTEALDGAGLWEGDVGAIFLCPPFTGGSELQRAGEGALESFSQLPHFWPLKSIGQAFGATFPLQCAAAALVLTQEAIPEAPKLEDVRQGVEMWIEEMPSNLLGDSVLVVGWTRRHAACAVLRSL